MKQIGVGHENRVRVGRDPAGKARSFSKLSRPEQPAGLGVKGVQHRIVGLGEKQVVGQRDLHQSLGFHQRNHPEPLTFEPQPFERGPGWNEIDRKGHLRPCRPPGHDRAHDDPKRNKSAEHGLALSKAEEQMERSRKK